MRKKILFCICIFCSLPFFVRAQIQVNLPRFSIYDLTPQSLCELNIINTAGPLTVSMEVTIVNFQNDRLIQIITNPFTVSSGISNLQGSSIGLASVNFGNVPSATYLNLNRLLPAGSYTYCARFFQAGLQVGEYCDQLNSDVSNTPFLLSPEDKEVVISTNPVFVWNFNDAGMFNLPTIADGSFPSEQYRFYLVELATNYTPQEGIQSNLPLFIKNNLRTNTVQYPADAPLLQLGHRYAWQIQKVSAGQILTTSEAWEFRYDTLMTKIAPLDYIVLKRNTVNDEHFVQKNLRVCYKEELDSAQLRIAFYNTKGQLISDGLLFKNVLKGSNCFEIDLEDVAHFKVRKSYLCVIRNSKGEAFQIRFIYKPNE
jgi:hypothetical protein